MPKSNRNRNYRARHAGCEPSKATTIAQQNHLLKIEQKLDARLGFRSDGAKIRPIPIPIPTNN